MQLFKKLFIISSIILYTVTAIAADNTVAKEETTPPPAEGALTIDQIPPLLIPQQKTADAPKTTP